MESKSQLRQRTSFVPLLIVVCGAPFLTALDLFVVNVAFSAIGADFGGAGLAAVSWTLSAYAIVFAALLIPMGSWADRVGNRRAFLVGVGIFTIASALAAAAPWLWLLIAARVLQAVGAAALTPASLALLITEVDPERRTLAVRIWAASSGMAAALGPVVGGVLVEISWRMAFLINVPVGVAIIFAAVVLLRQDEVAADDTRRTTDRGDLIGAALVALTAGLAVLYIVQGDEWGWGSAGSIVTVVAAVGAGVAFWWHDSHTPSPLIPTSLFAVPTFTLGTATMLLFSLAFAAGLLNGILFLQNVWGYSVIRSGLAIAPGPAVVPVFAVLAGALATRISPWTATAVGCLLWAVGQAMLSFAGDSPAYLSQFLPGWMIGGIGVGLTLPSLMAVVTAHLPATQAGRGSAVVTMARQLGTVIGASVLVALLAAGHRTGAWWTAAAIGVVAGAIAFMAGRVRAS